MAWRYIGSTLQLESTERCIAPIVSCLLISTHHAALTFLCALLLTCVNIKPSFTVLSNYFILSHVRAFYVLKSLLMAFKNDQIIIYMINVKKNDGSWDWQPFSACFFLFLFTLHNAWLNAEILLNQLMVQNQKKCCSCTVNEAKPVKKIVLMAAGGRNENHLQTCAPPIQKGQGENLWPKSLSKQENRLLDEA